jgi:PAS domain S-box-containing protein
VANGSARLPSCRLPRDTCALVWIVPHYLNRGLPTDCPPAHDRSYLPTMADKATLLRVLNDPARLAALRSTRLLDAPPEEAFDRLIELASQLLGVPTALVSFVDADRQFFANSIGISEPWKSQRGTALSHSFCQHVVADDSDLIVEDARTHPLVFDNLAIEDLGVVAYAGTPLRTAGGAVLGSFCAIDSSPRQWSDSDIRTLKTLAAAAMAEIDLRFAYGELREREARFRSALEQVRALAVTINSEGRITFVNDFLVALSGWTREELIGQLWFDTVGKASAARAHFAEGIRTGTLPSQEDGVFTTRSGEERLVAWDNIILRNADGDSTGVAGIGHDVTAVRETARLKDELISLVSHELRTPLTAIRAGLRLVSAQVATLDDKSRRIFGIAERNGERLTRMVNDLLDLERFESGEVKLDVTAVESAVCIEEVIDSMALLADEQGIMLRSGAVAGSFLGDRDKIVQVLTNLVANAVKFTPAGGSVTLSSRVANDRVTFAVSDTGRGIPEASLGTIFERFRQVELGDSARGRGVGLGLAISQAIVRRHGGAISVESEPGKGSVFSFWLPLARDLSSIGG